MAWTVNLGPCDCCGAAGDCCPKTTCWGFTVGTVTGDDCTGLSGAAFRLRWVNDPSPTSRRWASGYTGPVVECIGFGQSGAVGAFLTCRPDAQPGKYTLTFETSDSIGLANYEIDAASWDCNGCNVMTKVSDQTCCTMPATITVCPTDCGCCPGVVIPDTLTATITGGGVYNGSYPLTNGGFDTWLFVLNDGPIGTCPPGGTEAILILQCADGFWNFYTDDLLNGPYGPSVESCDPFALIFTGVAFNAFCGVAAGATVTVTI